MKHSELFKWNLNDAIKAMVMTVVAALLSAAYQILVEDGLNWDADDYKEVLVAGLLAGITYALKNFFTNSDRQIGRKEVGKRRKLTNKSIH